MVEHTLYLGTVNTTYSELMSKKYLTIVEILVVMLCISIFISITIPSITYFKKQTCHVESIKRHLCEIVNDSYLRDCVYKCQFSIKDSTCHIDIVSSKDPIHKHLKFENVTAIDFEPKNSTQSILFISGRTDTHTLFVLNKTQKISIQIPRYYIEV